MRFLANENSPLAGTRHLRRAGHDVAAIPEDEPGMKDSVILAKAIRESRIVLTFDRDFGELIFRRKEPRPPGIVYFRYTPISLEEPAEQLLQLLACPDITLLGKFTVVYRNRIRQRNLP
jgi:predicted nuclease of predicted toxin-antitoxin system